MSTVVDATAEENYNDTGVSAAFLFLLVLFSCKDTHHV